MELAWVLLAGWALGVPTGICWEFIARARRDARAAGRRANLRESLGSMVLPSPGNPSRVIVVRSPVTNCVSCPATFPGRSPVDLTQDGWRHSEVLGGWRCDACMQEASE